MFLPILQEKLVGNSVFVFFKNYGNDDRVAYYQPAIDVNKITVSYLLTRMDEYGYENFKIDTSKLFSKEWKALLKTREDMIKANDNILLKDL